MVLVDNPGFDDQAYGPIRHAEWNGWTCADLIFPSFLFLVGVAIVLAFSARLRRGESRRQVFVHAVKRSVALFVIGLVVNGFPLFHLSDWRIEGVLQRIALCYLGAAILVLWSGWRAQLAALAACLLGYWALLALAPVPGLGRPGVDIPFLDPDRDIVAWVDRALFMGHLYDKTHDPEGLLSTIPSLGTCLAGVLAGQWLLADRPHARRDRPSHDNPEPAVKASRMALAGAACLALGLLWDRVFPINKHLWTSSFAVFTAGFSLVVVAALTWGFEVRRWSRGWTMPLLVLGMNPIAGFVADALVYGPGYSFQVPGADGKPVDLHEALSTHLVARGLDPAAASLVYSVCAVAFVWGLLWVLWRRRIFLKV
jgi:predicted acyltransferase